MVGGEHARLMAKGRWLPHLWAQHPCAGFHVASVTSEMVSALLLLSGCVIGVLWALTDMATIMAVLFLPRYKPELAFSLSLPLSASGL